MEKSELESLLNHYDDLYYNQDDPEISDAEYDALKKQYTDKYGEYNYVPGEASDDFPKYTHTTNVLSLDKLQITDTDGLRKNIERLWPVVIQPKMDGLTLVSYPDGTYVSRGNGHIGEDLTKRVQGHVEGLGTLIDNPVRSEIVMPKSYFEELNAKREEQELDVFKNPRNAAAGMLRNKDISKVEGLRSYAYNILGTNMSAVQQLHVLREAGWNIVDYYIPKSVDDAIDYIKSYEGKYRNGLDYEIDGLVIKHMGTKQFGETGHHPKNAIAVKFAAQGAWTRLKFIRWQVGRTGKITPVAIFEPIEIMGATITRATLHNNGIIEALGLSRLAYDNDGDCITEVKVIKANDVIPEIIEARYDYKFMSSLTAIGNPEKCPACGGEVEVINDQAFCKNPNCYAKVIERLIHLAKRDALDIEGLSDETAMKIIDNVEDYNKSVIENPAEQEGQIDGALTLKDYTEAMDNIDKIDNLIDNDTLDELEHPDNDIDISEENIREFKMPYLFEMDKEYFEKLPGFGKRSAKKLYDNIQAARNTTMDRAIYAAGMPLIGRHVSKLIQTAYNDDVQAFIDDYPKFEKLEDVDGIGEAIITSLSENFDMFTELNRCLKIQKSEIKKKESGGKTMTFVITGKFDTPRDDIKIWIEERGHKVSGSVSSKTDYLVISDINSNSTKANKARQLGIKMISLDELENLLTD